MKMRKSTHLWREEDHPRDDYGRFCKSNHLGEKIVDNPHKMVNNEKEKCEISSKQSLFVEKDILKQLSSSLRKGIKKYEFNIKKHEDKIKNPEKYVENWEERDMRERKGLVKHWEKEIRLFRKNIEDRLAELKKRGDL